MKRIWFWSWYLRSCACQALLQRIASISHLCRALVMLVISRQNFGYLGISWDILGYLVLCCVVLRAIWLTGASKAHVSAQLLHLRALLEKRGLGLRQLRPQRLAHRAWRQACEAFKATKRNAAQFENCL